MYYRKDVGPILFRFLDSNDLVYEDAASSGSRVQKQVSWLNGELEQARAWTGPGTGGGTRHRDDHDL
jgi:hypothetical protein